MLFILFVFTKRELLLNRMFTRSSPTHETCAVVWLAGIVVIVYTSIQESKKIRHITLHLTAELKVETIKRTD